MQRRSQNRVLVHGCMLITTRITASSSLLLLLFYVSVDYSNASSPISCRGELGATLIGLPRSELRDTWRDTRLTNRFCLPIRTWQMRAIESFNLAVLVLYNQSKGEYISQLV